MKSIPQASIVNKILVITLLRFKNYSLKYYSYAIFYYYIMNIIMSREITHNNQYAKKVLPKIRSKTQILKIKIRLERRIPSDIFPGRFWVIYSAAGYN